MESDFYCAKFLMLKIICVVITAETLKLLLLNNVKYSYFFGLEKQKTYSPDIQEAITFSIIKSNTSIKNAISLNIFYFQNCTLQHINNTITQRNRIGTKVYSLYSSSPERMELSTSPN